MKRAAIILSALLLVNTPAEAQFGGGIVHDPALQAATIPHLIKEVEQAMSLVQAAKQNLAALQGGVNLTNLQGRISSVQGLLAQAQTACQAALSSAALPSACKVQANVATAQAAQFGAELSQLQGLQAAIKGTTGGLQAQQATAAGLVEVATQLQELRQAQNADVQQKAISAKAYADWLYGKDPTFRQRFGGAPGTP
jgi:hypothetical protein